MADEKKSVIIDLKFNVSDFTQSAAKLNKEIADLTKQQAALKKANQEGSIEFQRNAEILKANRTELAENNKVIQNLTIANKENEGSNQQLKAQLSLLTLEYNKLSKEERESGERGKELNAQINQTTADLKANEKGIGDNRREVGNYALAMSDLKLQVKEAKGEALAMAAQYGVTSVEFQNASAKAGELADKLKETNEAAKVFTTGSKFEAFGNSLRGVGSDLASLDFEGAGEKAKQLLAISKSMTFAEAINGIKGVGQTIISLGKALLTNPFILLATALVGLGLAAKQMFDTFKAGDKILAETQTKMRNVRLETESLTKANRDVALQNELDSGKITQAAFDRAKIQNKLGDELLVNERKRQDAKLEAERAFNEAKNNFTMKALAAVSKGGALLIEENLLKQKNTALLKIDEEFNKTKQEIIKGSVLERKSLLIKAEADEVEIVTNSSKEKIKVIEKENTFEKEMLQRQVDLTLELEHLKIDAMAAGREKAAAELQQAYDEKILTLQGQTDEEIALRLALAEKLKQDLDAQKVVFDEADKQKALTAREEELSNQLILAEEDYAARLVILEQQRALELENANLTQSQKDVINKKYNKIELDDSAKLTQLKIQQKQQELSAAAGFIQAYAGLMKEGSIEQKALMSAGALVNTYAAASAALAPPPVGAGPILGPVIASTAVLQGLANVAKINGVKLAKGGIFGGESHDNGGTKGWFSDGTQIEVEKGELFAVVNKTNTAMLSQLSALNSFGGNGVSFGGSKSYLADGGIGFTSSSTAVENQNNSVEQMVNALREMPTPVVAVQDINEIQTQTNRIEVRAML